MPELETVDLNDVEILAANVTIHGRGSPPAGDRYTPSDLQEMADAHRELAAEMRPAAWIGHSRDQPAVGHLENLRVVGDRLLSDVKGVPKTFAQLLNTKAYNARSVELSRVTSQKTGKSYAKVVSGLAWLGAKLPAVGVLADVVALYEDESQLERVYVVHADGGRSTVALLDFAVSSGRISADERPSWTRAFEQDEHAGIAALAQLPSGTAISDEQYRREFEERFGGPVFTAQREDNVDPEAAEIAALLGINPREVI